MSFGNLEGFEIPSKNLNHTVLGYEIEKWDGGWVQELAA